LDVREVKVWILHRHESAHHRNAWISDMSSQGSHFRGSEQEAHLPELSEEKPPLPNSEEKETWPVQMESCQEMPFAWPHEFRVRFDRPMTIKSRLKPLEDDRF